MRDMLRQVGSGAMERSRQSVGKVLEEDEKGGIV